MVSPHVVFLRVVQQGHVRGNFFPGGQNGISGLPLLNSCSMYALDRENYRGTPYPFVRSDRAKGGTPAGRVADNRASTNFEGLS